jgi:cyclopropane-fatty-acyl-phospholipid synthase
MIADPNARPRNYVGPQGRIERLVCAALFRRMLNISRISFGDPSIPNRADTEFIVAPPRFWTAIKLLAAPDLYVGDSYVAGDWYLIKGRLSDFLQAIEQDARQSFKRYYDLVSRMKGVRYYLRQYLLNKHYTRKVKGHYEVDSKIYEKILDDEMLYTCAFFKHAEQTLEEAQQNKINLAIERMCLPDGPARLLDIGSGWGGMARAVVKKYDQATVCGLSISKNQIAWAKQRDAGTLSKGQLDRVDYCLEDYVDHRKFDYYDAISVVGMIEHVGLGGHDEFFGKVHSFLKSDGIALVHTIISPLPAIPTNRWIDKHIFTGGYAPSLSELLVAAEKRKFRISGVYIHQPRHYRRTIECWLENLLRNMNEITEYLQGINYSEVEIEKFTRTWVFYLSAVRNMFADDEEMSHQVVQVSLTKL